MNQYGKFDIEPDGRYSGHKLFVTPRKDGKFRVEHVFGSGRRITEILTQEKLQIAIKKVEP